MSKAKFSFSPKSHEHQFKLWKPDLIIAAFCSVSIFFFFCVTVKGNCYIMNVWLHAMSRLWHCVRMIWSCRKHKENKMFSFLLLCMSRKVGVSLNQCLCILISLHCREIYVFLGVLCEGDKWKYECKCANNELEEHIYWRKISGWKKVYSELK